MARVLPAVMLFVRSLGGVSHTSAEDSREEDVELGVRALYELTRRVCGSVAT
jgi:acetylornithine deacetylase/succinyl-diaminopimelate desuccinylase-like protein